MGTDGSARPRAGRTRRAVVIGATVVATAWLGLRAVPAMTSRVGAASALLQTRRALLYRVTEELTSLDALEDTTTTLRSAVVALAPLILSGPSPAEATADLVGRITHATDRSQVKLTGADPMVDSAMAGGLRRVGVRVTVEGDIRGVIETLRALEADPGALLLDDLRVLALEPTSEEGRPEVLRAELTVRGWHQVKGPRP